MGMRPAWIKGKTKQYSGDLEFGNLESFPSGSPCLLSVSTQVPSLACSVAVLTFYLVLPTLILFVPPLSGATAI